MTKGAFPYTLNIGGQLLLLNRPLVMGILNITQESFYAASRSFSPETARLRIKEMIDEGADIIDIGACSTKPGATPISEKEEKSRLDNVLSIIRKENPEIIISIDTFRPQIAEWCVKEYGVQIINDVTGGDQEDKMFETISNLQVPYILTHSNYGATNVNTKPGTSNCDLWRKMTSYFAERCKRLRQMGINDIIIDPGFGFGKTLDDNYLLMSHLEDLHIFGSPILVGISRKSMIHKYLNCTPSEALNGTTALHTIALMKGAHILRVHDVKAAVETIHLVRKIKES